MFDGNGRATPIGTLAGVAMIRRSRGAVLLVVAVTGLLVVLTGCGRQSAPGTAPVRTLVNLGDSYAAGAGVFPLVADSPTQCLRSSENFAHLIASTKGLRLDDVSCSGADTADFFTAQYFGVPPQLDAVAPAASDVTMMIGGNDSDVFSGAISDCSTAAASNPTGSPCAVAHGDAYVKTIRTQTYPDLVKAFTAVRAHAPEARVMVVGYPWILPATGGCYPTMRVAAGDVPYLRGVQAALNDAVRRAAARTGVRFVDMSVVSEGHDACAPVGTRWIEPQVDPQGAAPVHPNILGHRAIAQQIELLLH